MKVSFIIPIYNCLPLTQAMLKSLQATIPSGLAHEIILIDDGSTDGTRDWLRTLENHPPFRVILNEKNLGYATSNNRAAASARGEFLVLLNNDLILTPRWLEPMLKIHARLPTPGIIGNVQLDARTHAIDHTGFFINAKGKPEQRTLFNPLLAMDTDIVAVTGACVLVDRLLWEQLHGFDEQFINGCEDIDLCFRSHLMGRTNAVSLRSIIYHHISSSPGRKTHDETNTFRLTQKWRDELARLGCRAWCIEHLTAELTASSAFVQPFEKLGLMLFGLALSDRRPVAAWHGIQHAIGNELARWQKQPKPAILPAYDVY